MKSRTGPCGGRGFLVMDWNGKRHLQRERYDAEMMNDPDPFENIISGLRAASDQTVAFHREHLVTLVNAYRNHRNKYDRDALLNNMVKAMMESDNTREDLCYQVVVAVDKLSER